LYDTSKIVVVRLFESVWEVLLETDTLLNQLPLGKKRSKFQPAENAPPAMLHSLYIEEMALSSFIPSSLNGYLE